MIRRYGYELSQLQFRGVSVEKVQAMNQAQSRKERHSGFKPLSGRPSGRRGSYRGHRKQTIAWKNRLTRIIRGSHSNLDHAAVTTDGSVCGEALDALGYITTVTTSKDRWI